MKILGLGLQSYNGENRYSDKSKSAAQKQQSFLTTSFYNSNNQIYFGENLNAQRTATVLKKAISEKIKTQDAINFFTDLCGIKIEKITDDVNSINFESKKSFLLPTALEKCKKAKDKAKLMGETLGNSASVPEFASKLYKYILVGGNDGPQVYPAGYLGVFSDLHGATAKKVSVPIIIKQSKGSYADRAVEVEKISNNLDKEMDELFKDSKTATLVFKNQKYELTRDRGKGGFSNFLYFSKKVN